MKFKLCSRSGACFPEDAEWFTSVGFKLKKLNGGGSLLYIDSDEPDPIIEITTVEQMNQLMKQCGRISYQKPATEGEIPTLEIQDDYD